MERRIRDFTIGARRLRRARPPAMAARGAGKMQPSSARRPPRPPVWN
ncbi:hypothetical protein BURMUCF1_0357 [Burkholderia multivorans ATCC BAA-247]|uniref:Uncharacterized protein n=1 Tax=Burkholderia multivorans CGD2 TaxID=513052 RepID=B9BXG4_9BURK|nr:hypothetical protein BURMUCGD2_3116 [Burkholderia multivorans CGD2]EEE10083.1 hypothetical protein BURMUCGD2M_3200 [Burkholderia multivorans CGD2M]EJO60050.1 hypothetical protein BURMUCF1_0357 [Burkholderia multivorans ATCC BAA-247]